MAAKPYRLRCSLQGHSMDVRAVATAHFPEGAIVTGSRDRTTRIWIPNESNQEYTETQCFTGPSHYISSICTVPPTDQYRSGLILVGSNDCCIYCFTLESSQPLYKLLGHSGVVCALAAGQFGTLLSGSWDKTARVWYGQKCVMTLEGHLGSVWAVQVLPKQGLMLTGSADKTIKLWRAGKCEKVFTGHEACVRGLAVLSTLEFLSCSNDCTVRHWKTTGECLKVYQSHTDYVYCVNVFPESEDFVSCGEDRTVRVWNVGECVQTIRIPAKTVWSVCYLPNGDIVVGSGDGIARIFTRHDELVAPPEELKAFEEELSKSTIPAQHLGDNIKLEDLPGPEALYEPGVRDGQTRIIREGEIAAAYQWVAADNSWQKIGDVVQKSDASEPVSGKIMFEGKEYDYIFDVDVQDGVSMKLPYNINEDPWIAAQKFIHRHNLNQMFLDQIANFIISNTKGMVIEQGFSDVGDPFTGSSRYIPSPNANFQDQRRSSSETLPGKQDGAAGDNTPVLSYFPQMTYLRFDVANTQGILTKLREFNGQVPPECTVSDEDLLRVMALANASTAPEDDQMATLEKIIHWPREFVFPSLDLLRLSIRGAMVNQRICETGGVQLCSHLLNFLISSTSPANQMLSLRTLCNMFSQPNGETLALLQRERIMSIASHCARGNKNTQIALSTLLLNYSVLLKQTDESETKMHTLNFMASILHELSDGEAQFRLMVAIGTLIVGFPDLVAHARQIGIVPCVEKLVNVTDPTKVGLCAQQLLAVFRS